MKLGYEIDQEADEHGIYDGVNVAAVLIRQAYLYLAFYADGCPACTDKLFQHVADFAINHVWQEQDDGPLTGQTLRTPEAKPDAAADHFAANIERVRRMIGPAGHGHESGQGGHQGP